MTEAPTPAWTVRQVAGRLGVSEGTVYRTAERGEIPAFKLGDAWRVRRDDIDAWIEHQQQEHGASASKRRRRSES